MEILDPNLRNIARSSRWATDPLLIIHKANASRFPPTQNDILLPLRRDPVVNRFSQLYLETRSNLCLGIRKL